MPLQKLQFRPGVFRDGTALSHEGGWFECDKVRFRSGYPEKIGGWQKDSGLAAAALQPPTGSYWGVCRNLVNWLTLAASNLVGLGTNLKFYLQAQVGSNFNDITPLRETQALASNAFTTTNGSAVVVVNDNSHGAITGDFVTISGVGGDINGIPAAELNAEHRVTFLSLNTYSITVTTNATSSGTTGACTCAYQINVGAEIYYQQYGWGTGGWGGLTGLTTTPWGMSSGSGTGVTTQLRVWSSAAYGQNLIINQRDGALYMWVPDTDPTVFNRAVLLSPTSSGVYTTDADCPSVCAIVLVSERFVIGFGVNDYGSSEQNPLLIRWSAQEDYTAWTPDATNQAGSYPLSTGSMIVAAQEEKEEILVWTDAALYSMKYVGPPAVFSTDLLAANITIAGPNAMATANNVTYWLGKDKFYVYNGRVQTLYCPLMQHIFGNINLEQSFQFCAGTNEGFNEIWWFYCSASSTEIDSYVIFNHQENVWTYGTMARTAWLDSPLRDFPMSAGYDGLLIYHETGVDDASVNPPEPIEAYIQSADFDIGDGHNYGFVWRLIPDISFDGSTVNEPYATFTARPRYNPGAPYGTSGTPTVTSVQNYTNQRNYTVQEYTEIVYVRIRGRQMAFKVSSNSLGVQWQLGTPRIDVRPDGRK